LNLELVGAEEEQEEALNVLRHKLTLSFEASKGELEETHSAAIQRLEALALTLLLTITLTVTPTPLPRRFSRLRWKR